MGDSAHPRGHAPGPGNPTIDFARPRIVAGFGRSGTTWVQDAIAEANQLRAVFEPLHPRLMADAGVHAHRYLSRTDRDDALRQVWERYFFGDYFSLWADFRLVKHRLYPAPRDFLSLRKLRETATYARKAGKNIRRYAAQRRLPHRIVKCIRANMMLSWLVENFQAHIVFIIRHPAAVAMSQMEAPLTWRPNEVLEKYRGSSALLSVLDERLADLLFRPLERIESHTLVWCIENSIALNQARECGIPVIYYESLSEYGEPQWRKIADALALPFIPSEETIARPSQQAWGDKAKDRSLVRQYGLWRERIDASAARSVQRILTLAGMHVYSVDQAEPVVPVAAG